MNEVLKAGLAPSDIRSRLIANSLGLFAIQLFFVLMLSVPTSLQQYRGVLLFLIVGAASVLAFHSWRVHRDVFSLWLASTLVGMFGVFWGAVNSTPGFLQVVTVYLIWPALFLLFIGLLRNTSVYSKLENALIFGVLIATGLALTVMFSGLFGFGYLVYPLLEFQGAGFGNYDGRIEFRTYGLTTVNYGFTFLLALVIVRADELKGLYKLGIYFLLFATFLVVIGSGRRAFWLVMLLSPFVILIFLQFSISRLSKRALMLQSLKALIVTLVISLAVVAALGLDLFIIAENFFAAFQGKEVSSGARFLQAEALWEKFSISPLIGHGFGSTVDVVRSHETPWAYELSYLALLMNVGLIGFMVYSLVVFWVFLKGVAISRRDRRFAKKFVPLISALSTFLIINATNPYLSKFDYLWVIFLPVALINSYLSNSSKND